jgi:DNA helicase-2/ATP-dependent DNA helicase PcrA
VSVALNPAQKEAVEHIEGPILVLAGAGSGKTRVLTARIARLIEGHGVDPRGILAVTFTNKAAAEMKHRVETLLGRPPDGLWIGTFHSICARLLRREAPLLGFTRTFTIYDEDDSEALVRRVVDDLGLPPKLYAARSVRHEISHAKNAMTSPAQYAADALDPYHANIGRVYAAATEALRRANAMDFDDLLLHPLELFRDHPERLEEYRARFRFILVDEYQDTNRAQYRLLQSLAQKHSNLFVVGDDDQSIYGWRGADLRNILEFQRDFPGAKLVRLEENYRSTRAILEVANAVIAPNTGRIGKTLRTIRQGGERVTVLRAADERDEAEWLVREFVRLSRSEYAVEDVVVLVRTNAQTRAFEEELRRSGVPYRVVGAVSFYERREVKDLLAYLRLIANKDDDEAFRRAVAVPRRGIGETSLVALTTAARQWDWSLLTASAAAGRVGDLKPRARELLVQFAAEIDAIRQDLAALQPAEALRAIIARLSYDRYLLEEAETGPERMENVNELVNAAASWSEEWGTPAPDEEGTALERFLAQAALTTRAEVGEAGKGLTLMTLHAAKGLEFPVVAIAGMEEGLFPLARADTAEGVEEERRLAYVGITRAKDRLYLSWAAARRRQGALLPGYPSRFLNDVPPALTEERVTRPTWGIAREPRVRPGASAARRQAPLALAVDVDQEIEEVSDDAPRYVPGERVKHRRFGSGTIQQVAGRGRDLKVAVAFDDETVGVKQLLAIYAGLEREWE